MTDVFQIIPPVVRAEGKDVPPEQIQAGFNSLARQTQLGLNSVATDPSGPASGDLGGMYPAPTVVALHVTSGVESGVAITACTIDSTPIGSTTPGVGAFTTLTATTPVSAASGGTGQNTLSAHNVLLGEGTGAVGFAAPSTAGRMLISQGAAVDPAFANNPVITGGSIDGAPVGATTPNTGAFTTLTASTAIGVASGGTGRANLTAHAVLIGEATAAINQVGPGTTGQALIGQTGADPVFGFPTGSLINVQTITSTGTYTPTAGTNSVIVEIVGGGGGSGGTSVTAATTNSVSGGGASGAFARARFTTGFSGVTVTIGAAGTAGTSTPGNGGTGGTSSFGTLISCPGGNGSAAAGAVTGPVMIPATGNTAAPTITGAAQIMASVPGSGGTYGVIVQATSSTAQGGSGGSNPLGTGGASGVSASGKGAGAGGMSQGASGAAQAGQAGAIGVCIIYEYA